MSSFDTKQLYDFLLHTPEQGLRKMLLDPKCFTDVHFNLTLKIVRSCSETQFSEHFVKGDFPKVKMGQAEVNLKEKYWNDLTNICLQRGLLTPIAQAA